MAEAVFSTQILVGSSLFPELDEIVTLESLESSPKTQGVAQKVFANLAEIKEGSLMRAKGQSGSDVKEVTQLKGINPLESPEEATKKTLFEDHSGRLISAKVDEDSDTEKVSRLKRRRSPEGSEDAPEEKLLENPSAQASSVKIEAEYEEGEAVREKRRRSPEGSEDASEEVVLENPSAKIGVAKIEAEYDTEDLERFKRLKSPESPEILEEISGQGVPLEPFSLEGSSTGAVAEEVAQPSAKKRFKRAEEESFIGNEGNASIECFKNEITKIIGEVFEKISPFLNFFKKTALHAYCAFRLPSHIAHANSYSALAELVEWYKDYIANPSNTGGVSQEIVTEVSSILNSLTVKIRSKIT